MKIIIDTREQKPWSFRKPIVGTLKTGDYSVAGYEEQICIERKSSVAEIAANFVQDRFWREMERMSSFSHKVCVFEFSESLVAIYPRATGIPKWKQKYIRVRPAFLFKCIERIRHEFGIEVFFFDNRTCAQAFAKVWLQCAVSDIEDASATKKSK